MIVRDALDEGCVDRIPADEAVHARFGSSYAVIHRVDLHKSLLEAAQESGPVEFHASTRVTRVEQRDGRVTAIDQHGRAHVGEALIGAGWGGDHARRGAARAHGNAWEPALALDQRPRIPRTARIVLSSREIGRIYHARGAARLVRTGLRCGRTPERFYDAREWLCGWKVGNCLAAH